MYSRQIIFLITTVGQETLSEEAKIRSMILFVLRLNVPVNNFSVNKIHELNLKTSLERTDNSEATNFYTFNCKGDNLSGTER